MTSAREAAEARSTLMRRITDRPQQRRGAERSSVSRGYTSPFTSGIQLRDAGETAAGMLEFTGEASVYDRAYEMWDNFGPYVEVVQSGAGAASLARSDLSVPLVIDHEPIRRIASTDNQTLRVFEDKSALRVAAILDPSDVDVAYIVPKIRARLIGEMSFRFFITDGIWSEDFSEYRIRGYDIHKGDTSIVAYGANPFTSGNVREDVSGRIRRALLLDQLSA